MVIKEQEATTSKVFFNGDTPGFDPKQQIKNANKLNRPKIVFLKMGLSLPLFVYFRSLHIQIQISNIDSTLNYIARKKRRCAWEQNPGLQDSRL